MFSMVLLLTQGETEGLLSLSGPSCRYPGKNGADGMLDQALALDGGRGGQGCHWALRSHTWRAVHDIPSRGKSSLVTHPGAQKGDLGCSYPLILRFGTLDRPALHLDLCCPEICEGGAVTSSLEALLIDVSFQAMHHCCSFCTGQTGGP